MSPRTDPDPVPDLHEISDRDMLTDGLLRYVVSVAIRAPSIHNSQPWRFAGGRSGVVELFADRDRQLPVVDPDGRQLHISAGAALHHAVLALHGIGRRAQVVLVPDPARRDLLARITSSRSAIRPDPEEWSLLYATRERHTHRLHFGGDRLPKALLVELRSAAEQQGGHVRFVELPGERRTLADAVTEATAREEADPEYRRELLAWTGREAGAADGVPASATAPPSTGDEYRQRTFGPSPRVWIPENGPEHPDILMLWSEADLPEDWLRTGAALSALLLTATSAGAAGSMLNQPLEIPALRDRIRHELRLPGFPQMLLRLGYSTGSAPTQRRPLAEVLTTDPDDG